MIQLLVNRDWSWDGFADQGVIVLRDGTGIGRFSPNHNISADALVTPDRTQTRLIFFDAIDPKPAAGMFPQELKPQYTVRTVFRGSPTTGTPLQLSIHLPVTTPPT